jgi:small subunit ribosomal protein S21
MLIVIVKKGGIEKSLKLLKRKLINTNQNEILLNRKEYIKPSILNREKNKKAIYIQKLKLNKD